VRELDLRVERQSSALGALARHACFVHADLAECLRRINEVAIATLDVARSSIWFLADDGLSLTCADIMVAFNLTALPLFGGREVSDLANVTGYVRRIEQRPAYLKAMQIAGPKAAPPT